GRLQQRKKDEPILRLDVRAQRDAADSGSAEEREQVAEAREVVEIESQPRLIHEDELARHAQFQLAQRFDERARLAGHVAQRFLHRRVLDGIELHGAQRAVQREDELPAGAADLRVAVRIAARGRGGSRWRGHLVPPAGPRRALVTAMRTTTSFSPAALRSASNASCDPMRPRAIAAHARNSSSSRRPRNPRPLRIPSQSGMPASPATAPYASKNAIRSVRSALRTLPFTAASRRAAAGLCGCAAYARAAFTRTSRSSSSSACSSACNAPGEPIDASAATANWRRSTSLFASTFASCGTAPCALSPPERWIASSDTSGSGESMSFTSCAVCADASRSAADSSKGRSRSLRVRFNH